MSPSQPVVRNRLYPAGWHLSSDGLWMSALLLSALALRMYRLNAGMWLDEILTYVNYAKLPFARIITTYDSQNQHLLYSLLAHTSFRLFGESAFSLRLPSVLFGVASIWMVYLLGREVADRKEAFLSAALLTFSYHHIWFSQNARGYMGLLFWTLLASLLLLRAMRQNRPSLWIGYALATALGVYTNTAMVFVTCGHLAIFVAGPLLHRRQHPSAAWWGMAAFLVAGLLTLLLHAPVLGQLIWGIKGETSTVSDWQRPIWALVEFVRALRVGFSVGFMGIVALVVFTVGLVSYARSQPSVIALLLVPGFLCVATVFALGHHLWPRLLFFVFGFAVLITIRGFVVVGDLLGKWMRWPPDRASWLGASFCAILVIVSALSLPPVYSPKQDYESAHSYVEVHRGSKDAVAVVGLATFPMTTLYASDWQVVKTLAELQSVRSHAESTWLVYTFAPELRAVYPDIMSNIESDFAVVREFYGTVGEGTIYVCRADAPRTAD